MAGASEKPDRGFRHRLDDGREVVLAPVGPEDRERLRVGVTRMSRTARYMRFFSQTPQLSEEQLTYFTEVDQVNHVAWGALDPSAPELPGVGLGRFIRESGGSLAEFAIAVIDDWQGIGLGRSLMAMLYLSAIERNITTLRGYVLPENERMARWLTNLGASMAIQAGDWRFDLSIDSDLSQVADTAAGCALRRMVAALGGK